MSSVCLLVHVAENTSCVLPRVAPTVIAELACVYVLVCVYIYIYYVLMLCKYVCLSVHNMYLYVPHPGVSCMFSVLRRGYAFLTHTHTQSHTNTCIVESMLALDVHVSHTCTSLHMCYTCLLWLCMPHTHVDYDYSSHIWLTRTRTLCTPYTYKHTQAYTNTNTHTYTQTHIHTGKLCNSRLSIIPTRQPQLPVRSHIQHRAPGHTRNRPGTRPRSR
jgi:hypothetical protein